MEIKIYIFLTCLFMFVFKNVSVNLYKITFCVKSAHFYFFKLLDEMKNCANNCWQAAILFWLHYKKRFVKKNCKMNH